MVTCHMIGIGVLRTTTHTSATHGIACADGLLCIGPSTGLVLDNQLTGLGDSSFVVWTVNSPPYQL